MPPPFQAVLSQCPTPAAIIKNDDRGSLLGTNALLSSHQGPPLARCGSLQEAIELGCLELTQMPIDNETWADHCDPAFSSNGFLRNQEGIIEPIKMLATRLDEHHCLVTFHSVPAESDDAPAASSRMELASMAYDVTENIPFGTYTVVLPAGQEKPHFSFMSTRFLEIMGVDRETVQADPLQSSACIHPDDSEEWLALSAQAIKNKTPFSSEARLVRDGQTHWVVAESNVRQRSDGSHVWEGAVMDITPQKRAESALKAAHAQLLEQATHTARLEERQRLLEDLHDGFASQLALAQHQLKQGKLSREAISQILRDCHDDLHLIVYSLQSVGDNLASAMADWRHRLMNNHIAQKPHLVWNIELENSPEFEAWTVLQILRIMQEAVANAIRHANANEVIISAELTSAEHVVTLRVRDDGIGFDINTAQLGQGIKNIKRRAQAIGGEVSWRSQDGGTELTLVVPVQSSLRSCDQTPP